MAQATKIVITYDDGSTQEIDATVQFVPKVEDVKAAVDKAVDYSFTSTAA